MFKHSRDSLIIIEEGQLPRRCELCDMIVSQIALQGGHRISAMCKEGVDLKRNRGADEDTRKANEVVFTLNGILIENVRRFVYFGRKLSLTDDDWPDIYKNLVTAWQRWGLISCVFRRKGVNPCISAMFYRAVSCSGRFDFWC
jgi:hypothetical protein